MMAGDEGESGEFGRRDDMEVNKGLTRMQALPLRAFFAKQPTVTVRMPTRGRPRVTGS